MEKFQYNLSLDSERLIHQFVERFPPTAVNYTKVVEVLNDQIDEDVKRLSQLVMTNASSKEKELL